MLGQGTVTIRGHGGAGRHRETQTLAGAINFERQASAIRTVTTDTQRLPELPGGNQR
jgi:hypothetical protein